MHHPWGGVFLRVEADTPHLPASKLQGVAPGGGGERHLEPVASVPAADDLDSLTKAPAGPAGPYPVKGAAPARLGPLPDRPPADCPQTRVRAHSTRFPRETQV